MSVVTPKTDFYQLLSDVLKFLDEVQPLLAEEWPEDGNEAESLSNRVYRALGELEDL